MVKRDRRVLVVWDDEASAGWVASVLTAGGFQVRVETDSFAGLLMADAWPPDLIMLNWEQPLVMGAVFRAALSSGSEPLPPIVAFTAAQHAAEAGATGAAVLVKPPSAGAVMQCANALAAPVADRATGSGGATATRGRSNRAAVSSR